MKSNAYLSEEMLLQKGLRLLMDTLGPVEASRFVNLAGRKRIDSVKRHRAWQGKLNKEKFFGEVFHRG